KQLDYLLPVPRRDGKFALWAHEGTAEFQELEIRALVPTLGDLKREDQIAADAVKLAEEKVSTAQLELESLKARIAAEKATFAAESGVQSLALAASRAERAVAVAKAALGLLEAEQQLARVRAAEPPGGADAVPPSPAVVEAEKKLAEARQALT